MKETKITRRSFIKGAIGISAALAVGEVTEQSEAITIGKNAYNQRNGISEKKMITFEDSLGRCVELPKTINNIVPSGKYAEAIIMTLCPEKIASITEPLDTGEKQLYQKSGYSEIIGLHETGELYAKESKNNTLCVKKIIGVDPDLILDVGIAKEDLKSNIAYIQEKSEIPMVFLDGSFGKLPNVYRQVGKIIGNEKRAEEIALFIESLYKSVSYNRSYRNDNINIYFAQNDEGRFFNEGYSFVNEAIKYIGATPITIEASGNNLIEIESLSEVKIDYIFFNDFDTYSDIVCGESIDAKKWWKIPAVLSGRIALAPTLFHNWIGFPLFAQTIGMIWMAHVIWPENLATDLMKTVDDFYSVLYRYDVGKKGLKTMLLYGNIQKQNG